MTEPRSDSAFLSRIAEEAHLSERDARTLVSDFVRAVSGFVGEAATEILIDLTPADLGVIPSRSHDDDASVEEFLLEMSDEEGVAAGRAAEHARVVAEALRSRATESDLARLQESIENESILALFELTRGELTEPDVRTATKQAQSDS